VGAVGAPVSARPYQNPEAVANTLAAREARIGAIADDLGPLWPELDDALVPRGVRVPPRQGVTLISAPVAAPPPVPSSPRRPASVGAASPVRANAALKNPAHLHGGLIAESARASVHRRDRGVPPEHVFYTYKRDVPLGPGEVLAFERGKGYYAEAGRKASRAHKVIDEIPGMPREHPGRAPGVWGDEEGRKPGRSETHRTLAAAGIPDFRFPFRPCRTC